MRNLEEMMQNDKFRLEILDRRMCRSGDRIFLLQDLIERHEGRRDMSRQIAELEELMLQQEKINNSMNNIYKKYDVTYSKEKFFKGNTLMDRIVWKYTVKGNFDMFFTVRLEAFG